MLIVAPMLEAGRLYLFPEFRIGLPLLGNRCALLILRRAQALIAAQLSPDRQLGVALRI